MLCMMYIDMHVYLQTFYPVSVKTLIFSHDIYWGYELGGSIPQI